MSSPTNPTELGKRALSGAPAESGELQSGASAGEYVIQSVIASGGCGTVYAAKHRLLSRRAAIKVLHQALASSPEMLQRFRREAQAVNQIRHPNIVDIYDFGELEDGRPYYVMELLEGMSLDALLRQRGRFSLEDTFAIVEPVCKALAAAHEHGVIHRDLKASNISVCERGGERIVKLLDFGIAKLLDASGGETGLTSVGKQLGTPHAMAPEQIRADSDIDGRADIYALGVLLFQMLTGDYPFRGSDPSEVQRLHLEAPPPHPSQSAPVSPAVDAVVLRCLAKERNQRFDTVGAFVEALSNIVSIGATENERSVPAVAISVQLLAGDGRSIDDALLDEWAIVLEELTARLRERAFEMLLETTTATLAVRALSTNVDEARAEKRAAVQLAIELFNGVAQRSNSFASCVCACVHIDHAVVRRSGGAETIVGGPIINTGNWAPKLGYGGAFATTTALDGLDIPARAIVQRYAVLLGHQIGSLNARE